MSHPSTRAYAQVATTNTINFLFDKFLQLVLTHRLQLVAPAISHKRKNLQLVLTHRLQQYARRIAYFVDEPSTRAYAQVATRFRLPKSIFTQPSTRAYAQVATALETVRDYVCKPSTRAYAQVATDLQERAYNLHAPSTRAYAQVATIYNILIYIPFILQLVLTHRLQLILCSQ